MIEERDSCLSRAPTRIDLGGGWTDVPPYSEREGGFVCNIAISRYATVRLASGADSNDPDPLVRAALARGGVANVTVTIHSDFPVGAGLGGSSAASAALLGAIASWKGEEAQIDRCVIAELGRRIEVEELGVPGGRQDHYAATHGGALALTFGAATSVKRIAMSEATRRDFVERSLLLYTGQSRISGDTITAVLGAYEAGDQRVVAALRRMRELAQLMADALARANLDDVGALLREHWEHQRALHPTIPTPRVDEIARRALAAGALGAKAMGASGGGCVLVFCREGERDRVREAIQSLGELVDFDLDFEGLVIEQERAS
jgi:D-glycero-alpha-D-manno-heptose-7-phosphate kinase